MTSLRRIVCGLVSCGWMALGIAGTCGFAQEPADATPSANPVQTMIVHGIVRNATAGSPLPRVLVRINGDAASAVLTDGDGRFEISDVPVGPQEFSIMKPGFLDEIEAGADSAEWNAHGYGHNVIVAPQMGDVVFTMRPVNSIVGQIQLSTGDPADGIQVMLLRRTVQDGRASWQVVSTARTNSEGAYRFGELADGLFVVYTEPAMDNDGATGLIEKGSANKMVRQGYVTTFYPDAHDLAGAAKIRLADGNQAQANMTLLLEPFQTVTATVTMPARRYGDDVAVEVLDSQGQGHQLPYPAQYDSSTQTVQAALPDGNYSFQASLILTRPVQVMSDGDRLNFSMKSPAPISGQVSFAVAGRAVSNLHISMSAVGNGSVPVTVTHSPDGASQNTEPHLYIGLTPADEWTSDNVTYGYAEGRPSDLPQNVHPPAGSYWAHTSIAPNTLCEASFTAGGASLAREPLLINESRSAGAPLSLVLRDDCAKLTLILPPSVAMTAGIERYFTVFAVPDFDSTVDIIPQTLRLSTGGRVTLTGLTPGNYHIYTFDHPVAFEYRSPDVLRQFPSQAVTLSPSAETQLTVEAPQP